MRWLILGAGGQVGRACSALAAQLGVETEARSRADLDICDEVALAQVLGAGPFDLVVNAAAYTAVDRAEAEPEAAAAINARAPGRLAELCHERLVPLVHFSTDYVFDGRKPGPYLEQDRTCPVSVYGSSKAAGEVAVREALPRHIIIRTSWVFSAWGRNFVTSMLRLAQQGSDLRIVADQHGGPTSATALATVVARIALRLQEDGDLPWGTYHFTGAPPTTWHGFAAALFEDWADLTATPPPQVQAIATADYPTAAQRPANSVLDCGHIRTAFGLDPCDWREDLRAVLQEIRKESGA